MAEVETVTIAELSQPERTYLKKKHPEMATTESALVVAAAESMIAVVKEFASRLAERDQQSQQLIEAMLKSVRRDVPDEAHVRQLVKNAEIRARFLRDVPSLTSAEVGKLLGSTAKNTAAKANRLKNQGKIFSVTFKNTDYFPAFQFGPELEPLPVVAEIISVFGDRTGWDLALWFVAPNGWLDGRTPAQALKASNEAVLEAARRSVEPIDV